MVSAAGGPTSAATDRKSCGKVVGHHRTPELPLPDGRVLRTRTTASGLYRPTDPDMVAILKGKQPIPLGVVEKSIRLVGMTPPRSKE
ncbi:hypothetical protein [Nocardia farcinica]|uniref:hypothetical protein n=1 Tax=Nocardia farcinica TaxID=37329 RepID=UPI0037ADA071